LSAQLSNSRSNKCYFSSFTLFHVHILSISKQLMFLLKSLLSQGKKEVYPSNVTRECFMLPASRDEGMSISPDPPLTVCLREGFTNLIDQVKET
jgi:hypothetical protein